MPSGSFFWRRPTAVLLVEAIDRASSFPLPGNVKFFIQLPYISDKPYLAADLEAPIPIY